MRAWALIVALLCAAGPAASQQRGGDPFNGQFGTMEIARPPAEAVQQTQLMNAALAGLQPQTPGRLDVYVVVASLWGEPVFEREATQAEEILRSHFGNAGRTIVLSAGARGGERRYPAASPNNINAALGRVGALIDPNEDLVVVFFTSHGSQDGSMSMQEPDRLMGSLRPTHLRNSLAGAGIRNRVVIISACFAGAFIAPLMNDDTIIIAAAAPDRTSFGCQPSRDWTFFGDAYFNHAVRNGAALVPAFDQAKVLITQWEREQNLTPPSNPQRYVGARVAQMLTRAEREAPR